jgi:serine/threonine-protein kinase RsbW
MELKKVTEKQFAVTFTKLYEMLQFVIDYAETVGFDKNWCYKIELVVEEALVNIIKYSGQTQNNTLSISLAPAETPGLIITLKDKGIPYNPLDREIKDVSKSIPVEERPIGGFGVHLIRQFMDKVEYKRENDTNVFILTKFLKT